MAEYYIEALDSGYRWNAGQALQTPVVLNYAIPDTAPSYYSSFTPYPEQHHDGLREALDYIETTINVTFNEAASPESAHLVFSCENLDGNVVGAAYYPYNTQVGSFSGDIFIDTRYENNPPLEAGDQEYIVVLHEIGHALGLKHSFEGSAVLPSAEDSHLYSVMSYTWVSNPYVETFSMYDIATLQYLYGANSDTNSGDTVYDLADFVGTRQTLWDGGGTDELDGSSLGQDLQISLAEGTFSHLDSSYNLAVALDVVIENARGGSGDDLILGNGADNSLWGNAGVDTFEGGQGDDFVDGGTGQDTALFDGLFAGFDFVFNTPDELVISDTAGGGLGSDTIVEVELFQFQDVLKTFQELYDAFFDPPANTDPDAVADGGAGFTTDEDSAFTTASVLGNDSDPDNGDVLTVVGLDAGGTLGTVLDNGDGTFDYDPNGQFEGLGAGEGATDSFSYTVSDGNGGTDTATVTVTVNGVDDAPPPAGDIVLALGVLEAGEYGNNYNGQFEPDGAVTASFEGTGGDLILSVTGYDIDLGDEVEVLLNGSHLGYLGVGPNDQENGGDSFLIAAAQQLAGENVLSFQQTYDPAYKWGFTDILLDTHTPPPADIALAPGVLETGEFGNNYNGQFEPDGEVSASFEGTSGDLLLSVTGYDIDLGDEVEVLLNGSHLGYLGVGPNDQENAGDSFLIGAGQQLAGENVLSFQQTYDPAYKWGFTDVLLEATGSLAEAEAPDHKHALDLADLLDDGGTIGGESDGAAVLAAVLDSGTGLDETAGLELLITA